MGSFKADREIRECRGAGYLLSPSPDQSQLDRSSHVPRFLADAGHDSRAGSFRHRADDLETQDFSISGLQCCYDGAFCGSGFAGNGIPFAVGP